MKQTPHTPFVGTALQLSFLHFALCFLLMAVSACSDTVDTQEKDIPLLLSAGGEVFGRLQTGEQTRADNLPEQAFTTTVYRSTEQGAYADLTGEWEGSREAAVSTAGTMAWSGVAPFPSYPRYGDWMYVVAVSPSPSSVSGGTASYILTGTEDLLYAPEIRGNRWDGYRFSGNPANLGVGDQALAFSHLLTRLRFKVKKKIAGGVAVKVRRVTVNGVKNAVSLPLAPGSEGKAQSVFSGNADLTWNAAGDGVETTTTTAVDLGTLLLPPLESGTYTLTVETSVGTYTNIPITFGTSSDGSVFEAGMSHDVTLEVSDYELGIGSVTVSDWVLVPVDGDLDIGN